MRISDWSSDVCSSDLILFEHGSQIACLLRAQPRRSFDVVPVRDRTVCRRALGSGKIGEIQGLLPFDRNGEIQRYRVVDAFAGVGRKRPPALNERSEEHTSELQSLMLISYAVLCLKKNTV